MPEEINQISTPPPPRPARKPFVIGQALAGGTFFAIGYGIPLSLNTTEKGWLFITLPVMIVGILSMALIPNWLIIKLFRIADKKQLLMILFGLNLVIGFVWGSFGSQ